MKYPMATTTLLYRRQEDGRICVTDDITGNSAVMTPGYVRFLRRLDGEIDPYSIPTNLSREEIDAFLDMMDDLGFIRHSRVFEKHFGTIVYTLWVPKMTRKMRDAAWIFDRVLKIVWLPALVLGAYLFWMRKDSVLDDFNIAPAILGWIAGLAAGVVLHELSHGFSAISNGAHLFEGGVLIYWFMPGAYVAIDEEHLKSMRKKVRILAAGVQMNFLLAGVSAMLMAALGGFGGFWLMFCSNNLLLGLTNTLFAKGTDGYKILIALLGKKDEDLFPLVRRRQNPRCDKRTQTASMLANIILLIWQIAIPIMFIYNVAVFFQ